MLFNFIYIKIKGIVLMNQQNKSFLSHGQNDSSHHDAGHANLDHLVHSHSHASHLHNLREKSGKVLLVCLSLTFSLALFESVGGFIIHSIALQTDAIHMFADAAGLVIAYFANKISKRPANESLTFGYGKAEVVGALINCMFTTMLTVGMLFEACYHLIYPAEVAGGHLLWIALVGLCMNGVIALILSQNNHSLNMKAALIHTLGDMLGALAAIVAGGVIYLTGWSIFDPLLSLVIIFILLYSNYGVMKRSIIILMAGTPPHLNYQDVGNELLAVEGVKEVHDLHIWSISANTAALASHIVVCDAKSWQGVLLDCQKMLFDKYAIEHVTLQHEYSDAACCSSEEE